MIEKRKTRIICTLGPSTGTVEKIRSLIRLGMNMVRLNFSHGDHATHGQIIHRVRQAAAEEKTEMALILDTKGPEIRTGLIGGSGVLKLEKDEEWDCLPEKAGLEKFGPGGEMTRQGRITVSYEGLTEDVKPGVKILIADGLVGMEVLGVQDGIIRCRVLNGGEIESRKNVNIIGVSTRLPALTEKDKEDLLFGHQQGVDYVAASFIRRASDVTSIQKYLSDLGSDIPVIAKIEDREGLENIDEIIRVSGGIMVARGDLGVQIPPEQVPLEQKRIIKLCNLSGKPVITATQMLDSMIRFPRPTRAEAADVANAIMDGTDCLMLSGETASGAYPEAAVEVMDRIAREVETSGVFLQDFKEKDRRRFPRPGDLGNVIAQAAVRVADEIDAACLVVPTLSGNTARLVSHYRPGHPIIAASPSDRVRRRLLLYWGIVPVNLPREDDSERMIQGAISSAIKLGFAAPMDKVVVAAGLPTNTPLSTNSIRIHVIGNVLGRGSESFGGRCTGRIVKIHNFQDLKEEASRILHNKGGEILVLHTLERSFLPLLHLVKGLILEGYAAVPREMILEANRDIVVIAHVQRALQLFEENITVTLDGGEKLIYEGAFSSQSFPL
ncbi:MAG: pyruvate kinase [Spirochaetales bacterium]|jgi:pyruvate kinase|nr:pyruvate kinase [Spirochaetales bacterium]